MRRAADDLFSSHFVQYYYVPSLASEQTNCHCSLWKGRKEGRKEGRTHSPRVDFTGFVTLTIVGIGNPTIDRGEDGRHFTVNGHLNMTGVTLTKGKASVSHVAHVNDCVQDLRCD